MRSPTEIGKIIRNLRGDMSLRTFAAKCHLSHTTLDNIEKGVDFRTGKPTAPTITTLMKIAQAAGVSLEYIVGNGKPPVNNSEGNRKGVRIPVLGKVAAGIPIEAITDIIDYEEIDAAMLKDGSEYFALQIKGDSMEPRIKDGDVVIVRRQPNIDSGQIGIVCINGCDATCKKIRIEPSGIVLIPFNSLYEPVYYSNQDIEDIPVRILGRVIELRAKFN